MVSKRQAVEAIARATSKGQDAARQIANPERRAKAMALAEQIQARTQDLQKAVKAPVRSMRRRRDRDQEIER